MYVIIYFTFIAEVSRTSSSKRGSGEINFNEMEPSKRRPYEGEPSEEGQNETNLIERASG